MNRSRPAAPLSIVPTCIHDAVGLRYRPASRIHRIGATPATNDSTDSASPEPGLVALPPGLIWGFELGAGEARPVEDCDGAADAPFRWLHLNLAHQGTIDWITRSTELPSLVKELMLSTDGHQRAVIESGVVSCVLHDFERDFDQADSWQIGAVHFALTPTLMITARLHPIRSADVIRTKLALGAAFSEPAAALDLLVATITEVMTAVVRDLSATAQAAEDAFLDDHDPPTVRTLIGIRRRLAQVHRLLADMLAVFRRLEEDDQLPEGLIATVEKLLQRIQAQDADVRGIQGQLHQLREELDMQADQRTSQNLYVLSILTALMLPATFVTGLFGMNTGGLPWASASHGTLAAGLMALGAAAATYLLLRWMGFMRR